MRAVLVAAAAACLAGLTGCAVYPASYDGGVQYGGNAPVVVQPQPVYIHGSSGSRAYPALRRDRDRDGIPNRIDRDRDGDGVPNRWDQRPNNPRLR